MADYQCKICNNTLNNRVIVAREMMFGLRDKFEYFCCSFCGCLQIVEKPKDMSKYYPSDKYYSYQSIKKNSIKFVLINLYLSRIGIVLQRFPFITGYRTGYRWLSYIKNIKKSWAVLDVGCGSGYLLQEMNLCGFKNLTGVDPFITNDIYYPKGTIHIIKTDIFNTTLIGGGGYDLIMLHHSFEHMDDPHDIFARLHTLLNVHGVLLIRIPIADSFAWRKYGSNWFQLDAPRHFFLHTVHSISILAHKHNFVIEKVIYDSSYGQFLYSEYYTRNIAFIEAGRSRNLSEVKIFKKMSAYLNDMHDGDQACFFLKKQMK